MKDIKVIQLCYGLTKEKKLCNKSMQKWLDNLLMYLTHIEV